MVSSRPVPRKIPLWKLVGGASVHCVVPAYLVALGVDGWRFASVGAGGLDAWLAHVPGVSLWFLGGYTALGVGATVVAALVRPSTAQVEDGTAQAALHLTRALGRGRGAFGAQGDAALDRIAALRPDLSDGAVRAMLRDLAAMVEAGVEAGRAAGETLDNPEIRAMSAAAIERIAGEMEALARTGAEQAQDRARIMATYVEQRYGQDGIK